MVRNICMFYDFVSKKSHVLFQLLRSDIYGVCNKLVWCSMYFFHLQFYFNAISRLPHSFKFFLNLSHKNWFTVQVHFLFACGEHYYNFFFFFVLAWSVGADSQPEGAVVGQQLSTEYTRGKTLTRYWDHLFNNSRFYLIFFLCPVCAVDREVTSVAVLGFSEEPHRDGGRRHFGLRGFRRFAAFLKHAPTASRHHRYENNIKPLQ